MTAATDGPTPAPPSGPPASQAEDEQDAGTTGRTTVTPEQVDGLATVLDLVRSGVARTRPELTRASGLGRSVITQRVTQLLSSGLFSEEGLGPSTGGRAPRALSLRAEAGLVLVAPLSATHVRVGVTDLAGRVLHSRSEPMSIATGPDPVLSRAEALMDEVLQESDLPASAPLFGVGVGVPGPVEFSSGRPVSPPIMPGWDGYDVRGRLAARYDVPVWVDNDVNVMALGELRAGRGRAGTSMIYIKAGTGIGAGLVSAGRLHRGSHGCAGDIGHITVEPESDVVCRCGKTGCLEALAGGATMVREGLAAAQDGRSATLRGVLDTSGALTVADVARAAAHGDPVSVAMIERSGRLLGRTLATLVNFFDPTLVVLGGQATLAGDLLLATIRQSVYRLSLPLATRDLQISLSSTTTGPDLSGAAFLVLDELFSRQRLGLWLGTGAPTGHPELALAGA